MKILGNILWLILGGLPAAIIYIGIGVLMCVTIIGIPFGIKLIELGGFALWPFGREVTMNPASSCLTTIFNVLWIVTGWWEVAAVHVFFGIICCITIIGIPWGKQHFKLARFSLFPFGCEIK